MRLIIQTQIDLVMFFWILDLYLQLINKNVMDDSNGNTADKNVWNVFMLDTHS